MSVVDLDQIPAMTHSIETALRHDEPIGPAIEPFIRLESLRSNLRPVEKFLTELDVTIHISEEGPRYKRLPEDQVVMCDPYLLPLNEWYSTALHEFLHWTEWRCGWICTPETSELRAEVGQAILEKLLSHPFAADLANYWKWHERWIAKLVADPGSLMDAVTGAVAGVEFLIEHACYEHVVTPERERINKAFEALLAHVEKISIWHST
jgi:hypothetical protein